jgi:hypothetical protein
VRRTGAPQTDQVTRGLRAGLDVLRAIPLLDGVLLEEQRLDVDRWVRVRHGLGRPWRGVLVSRWIEDPGAAGVLVSRRASIDPTNTIELRARYYSTDPLVDLWIF